MISPTWRIVMAMVIWGSIGLFVKQIKLPAIEIAFLRAAIASLCLFFTRRCFVQRAVKGRGHAYSKKDSRLLIFSGIALGLNWLFLFKAYKYTTLTNATLSYYMAPVFAVILAPIVVNERLTVKKFAAILLAVSGMICIIGKPSTQFMQEYDHTRGIIYGVIAALFYACVILSNRKLKGVAPFDRTFGQMVISMLLLIPIVLIRQEMPALDLQMGINILVIGIIHTGLAYLLYFPSIEYVSVQKASILSYIDPISAVIWGSLLLHEPLSALHIIGGGMILLSAVFSQ